MWDRCENFRVKHPRTNKRLVSYYYDQVYPDKPLKTNMAGWKIPLFEDVFAFEHGDFPASHVGFQGCNISIN